MKQKTVLFFFLVAGIVLGELVAAFAQKFPFLSWLAFGKSVGVPIDRPFVLDLSVLRISLGLELGINVAQIFFVLLAIFLYQKWGKKL